MDAHMDHVAANPQARELADLRLRIETLRAALELIAAPMRPDGTYNRGRDACRIIALRALGDL